MRRTAAAWLIAASVLAFGKVAHADVIERVVAVVNDDAIFLSELRRRAVPMLPRVMALPTQTERAAALERLYDELLDHMVQEQLFLQAADRMQVSVTRAEIDRAIANVQRQSQLNDDDFWAAVRSQGFTPEQYRSDVRRQLLRLKVLNSYARNRVNITEDQVRQRYEMSVANARRDLRYSVDQIFIGVPSGASATELAAARAQAQQIRDAIHDGDEFGQAMAQVGGGSLGWLTQGSLPEEVENQILALEVGEISQPIRGPAGFQIFFLRDRQQGAEGAPAYEQVRMQIYQGMMQEAMEHQEEIFLAELRRQAVIDVRL